MSCAKIVLPLCLLTKANRCNQFLKSLCLWGCLQTATILLPAFDKILLTQYHIWILLAKDVVGGMQKKRGSNEGQTRVERGSHHTWTSPATVQEKETKKQKRKKDKKERKTRQDKTRQNKTKKKERQDKTRQDKTRQDKTRQDKTRQDKTRQDKKRTEKKRTEKNRKEKKRKGKKRKEKNRKEKKRKEKKRTEKKRKEKKRKKKQRKKERNKDRTTETTTCADDCYCDVSYLRHSIECKCEWWTRTIAVPLRFANLNANTET